MSYRRITAQSYDQKRRSQLKTGGLRKTGRLRSTAIKGYTSSATKSTKQHAFYANIMDLTRFLARYLSGKGNVMISTVKGRNAGYSVGQETVKNKPFYHVRVPDWQSYDLPLQGFDKYRIYRSGLWHESEHIRHTPDGIYTYGQNDPLSHDVINVIEDRRIEDLGVEDWRGYLPERLYTNAYGFALRPDVGDMYKNLMAGLDPNNPGPYAKEVTARTRYEAFLQKLIVGKIKGDDKFPQSEREKVESVVKKVEDKLKKINEFSKDETVSEYARQVSTFRDMTALTEQVIDALDLRGHTPSKGSSWDNTFTEEFAKENHASPEKVKEDMEGFFDEAKKEAKQGKPAKAKESEEEGKPEAEAESPAEPSEITEEDVEEAAKGSDQVIKEYQEAQKIEVDDVTPMFGPVASAVPPLVYRDQPFITKMNTSLREWKVGRKEVAGETGSRLSIPQYVHHKEEPFVTRIRKSAKGRKILVVADFSQSMEPQEDDYKKALISSMEVLDGIGAKTALYGFGGEKGGASEFFFKVKRFEDPKWKPDHSAKTAALTATMGYTPTDRTYGALAGYIKKHRPDVTVTITDGSPNGNPNAVENTKQLVKELKRHTRMVAFGIGENAASARQMEEDLRGFGYNRVFSVDNLHQIPPKLVNLIAPA